MLSTKSLKNIKNTVLPSWFKALVITASNGGKNSYFEVGYHTCLHLENFIDDDEAIEEFNNTN